MVADDNLAAFRPKYDTFADRTMRTDANRLRGVHDSLRIDERMGTGLDLHTRAVEVFYAMDHATRRQLLRSGDMSIGKEPLDSSGFNE